jgi:K+/H+ antiporter YhaU regulatory subunit KhtT
VVAVTSESAFRANPPADAVLPAAGDLLLIGDSASEHRFLTRYRTAPR